MRNLIYMVLFFMASCHSKQPDSSVVAWFDEGAANCDITKNLHLCSQWSYLSSQEYDEMIMDSVSKLDPALKDNESIFDLGVGVGAVLQVIRRHKSDVTIGGSDLSSEAIKKAKEVFPQDAANFFVHDMTKEHLKIPNNFYDHVVSFGALAMYLTKDQMLVAIKEAVRMTKPGGSLVFTSFIEPGGTTVGSIIEKVEKTFWASELVKLGVENVKIYPMKHQGDRYQIACTKK